MRVILEFWKRWSGWDFLGRCLLRQALQVMRLCSGLFCAPAEVGGDVVVGEETPALHSVCRVGTLAAVGCTPGSLAWSVFLPQTPSI